MTFNLERVRQRERVLERKREKSIRARVLEKEMKVLEKKSIREREGVKRGRREDRGTEIATLPSGAWTQKSQTE